MLVLSRHIEESIFIGPEDNPRQVMIKVIDIRGDKVRLGIDAPPDLRVDRSEITKKREEQS